MPPKGKGKKGKKGDDDDFWATAGESAAGTQAQAQPASKGDEDDAPPPPKKSAFVGLDVDDGEEDDGQDNLMAMLQKRKDKKKNKKAAPEPDEAAADDDITKTETTPAPAKSMTAEELADEEFGPVKEKKKKKGKDKKPAKDDEGTEAGDAPAAAAAETANAAASGDEDGEGPKLLSKKEKEKLKKEKEKAKKKAQAAAKKAQGGGAEAEEDKPTEPSAAPEPAGGEDDEGEGAGESAAKKKKKKAKKKADDDEPAPAAAPAAKGKKATAGLSALRAALEQKRQMEEEAKRKAEEERRRIEEEERAAEEAARKKEEEKQRRKDKEKKKREELKQKGLLLTDKQKKEQRQAELRREALIKSGAIIEGLSTKPEGSTAPKKVVYGKRQRGPKQSATAVSETGSSAPSTPQAAPAAELPPEDEPAVVKPGKVAAPKEEKEEDAEWDASSAEEDKKEKAVEEGKDDWDASSDEEKAPAAKPAPAKAESKPSGKPAPSAAAAPKQTPASKNPVQPATKAPAAAPPKPTAKPVSKATAPPESSSEEESESESESDSDDDSDDSDEDSSDEELTVTKRMEAERKAAAAARRQQREAEAKAAASKDNLRSPICCILGHVDTGKTKLLDKIRQTNVQEGEAGGITQQIGATYFPVEAIKQKTAVVNQDNSFDFKIPGLLIIDTPGHESFTNLRSRGSSLCNIAILVVDIMHGLEPQTIESINLLKQGSVPFIIALNKIDRLYGWKTIPDNGVQDSLEKQNNAVKREFETRSQKVMLEISEQGLNSQLYWKNTDPRRVVNVVPTSAITGEGVPDMIKLLVELTQTRMVNSLMYISTLECTVLEVKVVEGLGTTIDVILSNGYLREGDKIVLCGLNGPIVTQVRALLMPQPLRELRVKSAYVHHKEVKAANGVKVVAPDLEKAIAGSKLLVCGPDDDEDDLIEEVMKPLEDLLKRVSKTQTGVHVQASTLGSLEALLSFLESSKIPVSGIQIGPVHKKDVRRAMTQLEKAQEMACILCFDVPVDKEAEKLAEESGVKLFKADIIYHLFDAFTAYNKEITEAKRRDQAPQAVWPCRLKIIAVFTKRDPILVGVDIIEGTLRVGTPLCVVNAEKQIVKLGRIASLHINHKPMEMVKKSQAGGGVAVKIEHAVYETPKMVGRHFDENDELLSLITRQSIDVLKDTFRNDVTKEEWLLIKNLKGKLGIP